jgi:hypothetical protein
MRVIIAGGRDFTPTPTQKEWVVGVLADIRASEVVSGGCQGADRFGEEIARERGIPIKRFPADWKRYGKPAGPRRNEIMAEYATSAGACILFPGGRGTADMKARAIAHGLKVIEWDNKGHFSNFEEVI